MHKNFDRDNREPALRKRKRGVSYFMFVFIDCLLLFMKMD